ncbi:Acyl-CoA N-acyltransferase [Rhypophila decipiens]
MPFLVRPATEADCPAIGHIGREAFRPGIGQLMYPPRLQHRTLENTDETSEGWPFIDEQEYQLKRAHWRINTTTTVVLVDTDQPDEILGYAHWEAPRGSPYYKSEEADKSKDEELKPVPPTFDRARMAQIGDEFDAAAIKALGENGYKDMWYLAVLCVHPNHQGKGVGKQILQWGMARAAEERKSVFLLGSSEGFPLYRSQGFQTIGEFQLCGLLHSRSMILPPPFPALDPATVLETSVVVDGQA